MLDFTLDSQNDRKLGTYFFQNVLGNLQLPHFFLPLWQECHYFEWPNYKDREEGWKMTTDLQTVCKYIRGQPGYCQCCGGWKRRNELSLKGFHS